MQEVKFTQIASYTGFDQQVQRVRFYLLNPAFMLGSPCKLYSIFRSFSAFFIIALVVGIVKCSHVFVHLLGLQKLRRCLTFGYFLIQRC